MSDKDLLVSVEDLSVDFRAGDKVTHAVKKVSFDREDINGSPMGNCIKSRARRMVFPAFEGEDVEVEIPLVLSKSM